MDISYDGRLAVTTHCDGTAIIWDIKYGSKISILNKQRKSYDQVILVCDRLGAFAQNENDIKYEKFSLINKGFPAILKKFVVANNGNDNDINKNEENEYKMNNNNKNNNVSLNNVPDYVEINIPINICDPSELAVDNHQKIRTANYDNDDYDDDTFLNGIDDEYHIMNDNNFINNYNINKIEINGNNDNNDNKQNKKTKQLQESNIDVLNKELQRLIQENKRLKGEVVEWRSMHQTLYQYTCNKIVNE